MAIFTTVRPAMLKLTSDNPQILFTTGAASSIAGAPEYRRSAT
ncbi:hypothetical protein [Polymorphobacter multimanifer]|uniref:Uncharacterized protein n=1 Tax=Polymorphobacter multimanifer TaxID=1070431 RepID=A0A841LG95_9SPHN|nr:hypothetical protein [Polymorphobacter multimanifer]MBB6228815.1 hypothetical protein [Polymorphobacter multimanifer]